MRPARFPLSGSRFCVVVHDVTPFFAREIERILKTLEPLVGEVLAAAAVPRWGGMAPSETDRRMFRNWSTRFGEFVLHGWTHRRERGWGVVSWCTGRANEFERLSLGDTLERLRGAQRDAEDLLGRPLRGFVPPAWRLRAGVRHLRSVGIEYLMRFRSFEAHGKHPVSLATWSWDWGWLPGTRASGAALGACCRWLDPRAIPTVVLHPLDVHRDCLSAARRLICRFLRSGLVPVLPGHLATPVTWDRAT